MCHPECSEIPDQRNQSEEFKLAQDAAQLTSIRHIPPAARTPTPHVIWTTLVAITRNIVCELCIGNIFVFPLAFARLNDSRFCIYHAVQCVPSDRYFQKRCFALNGSNIKKNDRVLLVVKCSIVFFCVS